MIHHAMTGNLNTVISDSQSFVRTKSACSLGKPKNKKTNDKKPS